MEHNAKFRVTKLDRKTLTAATAGEFHDLIISPHERLVDTFISTYNSSFDNTESCSLTNTNPLPNKPFLPSVKFKLKPGHFTEYTSEEVMPVFMYAYDVFECFNTKKEALPHRVLFELILSPVTTREEYDLNIDHIELLLINKSALRTVFMNNKLLDVIRAYIKNVDKFLLDHQKREIAFDVSLKDFKQNYFCPDLKSFNKKQPKSMLESDYITSYNKHIQTYAATDITYPIQYYVFLAITLKGLLETAIPSRSRTKTSRLLLELWDKAYK